MTMMSKSCSVCREDKPLFMFYRAAKAKTGYGNRCKACELAYQRARKAEKQETQRRWYAKNGSAVRLRLREKTKQRRIDARKECLSEQDLARWRRDHAQRSLRKLQATPAWVDAAHRQRISAIYAATQQVQEATGTVYHVDHIVPLVNERVCGLHVWWNLQPLPELLNIVKNNTFDPTLYPEQDRLAFSGELHATQLVAHKAIDDDDDDDQ